MSRRMPAEWEPHTRTWMAWPSTGYTLGDTADLAEEARRTWAAVANAVIAREPLTMLVGPEAVGAARAHLDPRIVLLEAPLDDAWFRDIGPTFIDDAGELAGVDWVFNGWGAQDWATWDRDALAARAALASADVPRIGSAMVNEGGGIHTDGRGTFLVTETVQLDPGRNPGWTRARVEDELERTLGARKVIWLPRGLTRDSERYGTRGHVDIVACFTPGGQVLVHDQRDPAHPDHVVSAQVREVLAAATDADGGPLDLVAIPAPATLRDDEGWVDWSYVNHYVLNGAVVACVFDDPHDAAALEVLAAAYPGREIVPVDARPIFDRGGGIHCITQQQPAIRA
ncbi:agmatine deiminase family protein [Demequina sp. SYSU T00192]|uniref:Agmatine deiminase family protein n=1 Tax=Demequina litoralis TaxID=3051660 RepID=A0ABT8G5I1_9MICO|nr:agmatine deiminase family protein [Demequina sp. SYSU T00192]MDN4474391.1 agmatine deiminase family protein [Demequina sp. SYSU T00192]